MIHIRPNAIRELQRLLNKRADPTLLVHLNVSPGGCFEWTYQLTLTAAVHPQAASTYNFDGFTLIVPNASLPYLQDLTIDYAEDLMGGGFRFINPQAQQTCGCGNSFSLNPASDAFTPPEDCTQMDRRIHSFND